MQQLWGTEHRGTDLQLFWMWRAGCSATGWPVCLAFPLSSMLGHEAKRCWCQWGGGWVSSLRKLVQAGCGHVAHPGFHCVATAPPSLVFLPLPGPKPEKPCLSVHSTVSMVSPSQVLGEKCVLANKVSVITCVGAQLGVLRGNPSTPSGDHLRTRALQLGQPHRPPCDGIHLQ